MIKEFLILNKDKLKFGLKWTSIIFTTIVLIAYLWAWQYGQIPTWTLFIKVILFAGVLLPIFCWSLGTFREFLEYKRTNEILNKYPFNELIKNGFDRVTTNQNSKWLLSQVMLRGHFEGYPFDCEVENGIFKMIALVNRDSFKSGHMKELKREFGKNKVDYDWFGIALKYNVKREKLTAYGQLNGDLERLVTFLKKAGLRPWD